MTATDSNSWDYDIIIAGAGIVGATLANALTGNNLRIGIIERNQPTLEWQAGTTDLRVSAITEASQNIFEHLGVWRCIQTRGISPFRAMYVWDASGNGDIHFDSSDTDAAQLGHIIENRVMQAALITQLQNDTHTELHYNNAIAQIQPQHDHISVQLDDNSMLTAGLLIGADGGQSTVRQLCGIAVNGWGYQQQAVVTIVETENSHEETAWQCFLPHGPLAFLPLRDGRCSIVWSTSPDQAQQLLQCSDEEFCSQLSAAFCQRLGKIKRCSERRSFPLRRQHAEHYVSHRVALIGDAAHTIHPLAGQGVNLGLLDAAALAETILEHPAQFASQRTLRRYERWRRGDNALTMNAMDGFKHVFGSNSKILSWLRNNGLKLADQVPFIKDQLIAQAMGRKSDLPQLARIL